MIRILIIDDEIGCCELIHHYLSQSFPGIHVLPYGHSVQEGVRMIEQYIPDIILLDIHLPDGTGFEILDQIGKNRPRVVFITAFDQFAIRAFQYNALDYLLKPVDPDTLIQTLGKVLDAKEENLLYRRIQHLLEDRQSNSLQYLTFTTQQDIRRVKIRQIIRVFGEGNYTTIFLEGGEKFTVTKGMKEMEELLHEPDFFRTHQSHLIQLEKVHRVSKEDGGVIIMENGDEIPLARRKKEAFLALFL